MMRNYFLTVPAAMLMLAGCAATDAPRAEESNYADGAVAERSVSRKSAPRGRAPASNMAMARESAPGAAAGNFAAVEGRQVAFSATLRISTPDVPQAVRNANAVAQKFGGYAATLNDRGGTFKIPVKNAEAALEAMEKLGTVDSREINAQDVTDTAFDLDMRIANLEKLHKRLTELVEKTGNIKDILEVEKELARVTGELEKLKASRQNLQHRVDFVTFRVYFSAFAQTPVKVKARKFLLPQVTNLGLWADNLTIVTGETPEAPFKFQLPKGFIPVRMRYNDNYFAVDDQDTVLSAVSFEQIEGADLEFWQASIARALKELRGYEVKSEIKTAPNGDKYIVFVGERLRGKEPMRYEASCRIVRHCFSPDEVYIVEILGTEERMKKLDLTPMHQSVK